MKRMISYYLGMAGIIALTCSAANAGPAPVPAPGTWLMMGTGVAGLIAYGIIKRPKK